MEEDQDFRQEEEDQDFRQELDSSQKAWRVLQCLWKPCFAVMLSVGVVSSMTVGVWISQKIQADLGYNKPILLTWISTSGLIGLGFVHPIIVLVVKLWNKKKRIRMVIEDNQPHSMIINGGEEENKAEELQSDFEAAPTPTTPLTANFPSFTQEEDPVQTPPPQQQQTLRQRLLQSVQWPISSDWYIPDKWSHTKFFLAAIGFCSAYFFTNFFFSWGVPKTNLASTMSLEQVSTILIYLGSILFLRESPNFTKFLTVFFCVMGVLLVAYSDRSGEDTQQEGWLGDIFILISTLGTATYMISLKKLFVSSSPFVINHLLFTIGLINFCFNWVWIVVVHFAGIETFAWPDWRQLFWIIVGLWIGLTFNGLLNFGIRFTSPLFVKYATSLTIPLAFFISAVIQHQGWNWIRALGAFFISIGFLVYLIRDSLPATKSWRKYL